MALFTWNSLLVSFEIGGPHSRTTYMNICLQAPFGSPSGNHLNRPVHLWSWGSHFTRSSTSVRSEMESPSGDGNTDISYPCRPEVRLPKEYDHSTVQTRQDINMTQSFLLWNTCHYISLSFIMSLHLTNEIHEIRLYSRVYTLEKGNTGDLKTYSTTLASPLIQEKPRLVLGGDIPKAINHHGSWAGDCMPRQQLTHL